jgi:hypothetical protein
LLTAQARFFITQNLHVRTIAQMLACTGEKTLEKSLLCGFAIKKSKTAHLAAPKMHDMTIAP